MTFLLQLRFKPFFDVSAAFVGLTVPLKELIHLIELPGRMFLPNINVYLINCEKPVLIDAGYGFHESTEKLLHETRQVTRNHGLEKVIITHAHPDHFAGAAVLKRKLDTNVAAHRLAVPVLSDLKKLTIDYYGFKDDVSSFVKIFLRGLCEAEPVNVDTVLEENDEINVGGYSLRVIHTPGHTPCHISLYLEEEGVLFSGDVVVGEGSTWIGLPCGDVSVYINSLKKLLKLQPKLILPAHGPVVYNPEKRIRELIQRKLSKEREILELLREKPRTVEELALMLYSEQERYKLLWLLNVVKAYLKDLERKGEITYRWEGRKKIYSIK